MLATSKLAMAAATGVLSLAVTGAAAFAAFQPEAARTLTAGTHTGTAMAQAEREGPQDKRPHDKVKDVLDKLVAGGVITQVQEDKIIAALKDARGDHDKDTGAHGLKLAFGHLKAASIDYLGIGKDAVEAQLKAGKSLGEIADATPGKSRAGLITFDAAQINARIDQLVADGKLSAERAARIKATVVEHVTKLVDHTFSHKPKTDKREHGERPGKGPKPSESPPPTT